MTKEVEDIILNKSYEDLSAAELEAVNELVSSAEEYEEMKWFLASTQQALANEKIKASPELKKKVMEHLNQDKGERVFWWNSVLVFLFPEDKAFYRKPAFQLTVAAVLVVGFLLVFNPGLEVNQEMALNKEAEEDTVQPVTTEENEEATSEDDSFAETSDSEELDDLSKDLPGDGSSGTRDVVTFGNDKLTGDKSDVAEGASEIDEPESPAITHDGYYGEPLELEETATLADESEDVQPAPDDDKDANNRIVNNNTTSTGAVRENDKKAEVAESTTVEAKKKDRSSLFSRKESKVSQESNNVPVEEQQGADYSDADALGGAQPKGESKEEIRPYSMHVNEVKELKQLFTTFK